MSSDASTIRDAEALLHELRGSAPVEVSIELSIDGRQRVGEGMLDGVATAVHIEDPEGKGPIYLVFPTYLIVHRLAQFFELGPRPIPVEDGALGIPRAHLDDPELRATKLADLPDEARDALDRDGALRWSVTLTDAATHGEIFARSLEVYDAHDGGIWLVSPVPGEDGVGLIVVEPASSSMVWTQLAELLPDGESWEAITAGIATGRAPSP